MKFILMVERPWVHPDTKQPPRFYRHDGTVGSALKSLLKKLGYKHIKLSEIEHTQRHDERKNLYDDRVTDVYTISKYVITITSWIEELK